MTAEEAREKARNVNNGQYAAKVKRAEEYLNARIAKASERGKYSVKVFKTRERWDAALKLKNPGKGFEVCGKGCIIIISWHPKLF